IKDVNPYKRMSDSYIARSRIEL
ncbi:hypothetical protein EVA_03732, partial [gut metagenome]